MPRITPRRPCKLGTIIYTIYHPSIQYSFIIIAIIEFGQFWESDIFVSEAPLHNTSFRTINLEV